MKKRSLGRIGEELSAAFLASAGMEIIAQNFHGNRGEVDIIARDGDVIVFVEVKTCRSDSFGPPEEWVTPRKQKRISQAAIAYLQQQELMQYDCRFDVVTVTMKKGEPDFHHIRNAFWLQDSVF